MNSKQIQFSDEKLIKEEKYFEKVKTQQQKQETKNQTQIELIFSNKAK